MRKYEEVLDIKEVNQYYPFLEHTFQHNFVYF